jgi:predicted ATPase
VPSKARLLCSESRLYYADRGAAISIEEALRFERIHEDAYRNFGFEIVPVEPGSLSERVAAIKAAI